MGIKMALKRGLEERWKETEKEVLAEAGASFFGVVGRCGKGEILS